MHLGSRKAALGRGGPESQEYRLLMAFGFLRAREWGGRALREKRGVQASSQSDSVPWVHQSGQKADDLEASQIKLVEKVNRPSSGSTFVFVGLCVFSPLWRSNKVQLPKSV